MRADCRNSHVPASFGVYLDDGLSTEKMSPLGDSTSSMSSLVINIVIVILLILVNGLFAMAELAIISARRVRLQRMKEEGSKGAGAALELAHEPGRFLSTVQVGITLIGILAGAFGGARIAEPIAEALAGVPVIGPYSDGISLFLVVGIITFLSVVVGELAPKRLALQDAERIASGVARPMLALSIIASPVVRLFNLSTEAVMRMLGVESPPERNLTEEEIRLLLRQGAEEGIIEEEEQEMVERVFLLGDRPLEALMTPRPAILWLDINAPDEENRRLVQHAPYSRLPVCEGNLDQVLGIVHARELLAQALDGRPFELRGLIQEPVYLPGGMRATRALERFRDTATHMGLVIDEYGGIDGLVTLFDILEAIVGDLPTPEELVEPPIVQREEGSWLVDGLLTLDELREAFDGELDIAGDGSFHTVGGFAVHMIGATPHSGDEFTWAQYRFEVMDMDGYRVDKLLVERLDDWEDSRQE